MKFRGKKEAVHRALTINAFIFLLPGLRYELEERLHRAVDIVAYRENMNLFLKKKIDGEAIYA